MIITWFSTHLDFLPVIALFSPTFLPPPSAMTIRIVCECVYTYCMTQNFYVTWFNAAVFITLVPKIDATVQTGPLLDT